MTAALIPALLSSSVSLTVCFIFTQNANVFFGLGSFNSLYFLIINLSLLLITKSSFKSSERVSTNNFHLSLVYGRSIFNLTPTSVSGLDSA